MTYLHSIFDQAGAIGGVNVNDVFANIEGELVDGVQFPVEVQDSRIRFEIEQVQFHQDAVGWYNNGSVCDCYLSEHFALDPCKYLNVFFFGRPSDNATGTVGCGPSTYVGYDCTAVNVYNLYDVYTQFPPGTENAGALGGLPWSKNPLIAHELGHVLGFGHSWQTCTQFPDMICPHTGGGCHANDPNEIGICNSNVMGYSAERRHWTPLQLSHMQQLLRATERTGWLQACDRDPASDLSISSSQTWELARVLKGHLTVESGVELTIKCKVNLPIGGQIVVKPGARLIIDGGWITNSCCDEFWSGIQVWGYNTHNQYGAYLSGQYHEYAFQGYVELKNGGTIEHARTGILMEEPGASGTSGGVVMSSGGIFRNCQRAVKFKSYRNFVTSTGVTMPNRSHFYKTSFVVDDDYRGVDDFRAHLIMADVSGVDVVGCEFANEQTTIGESDKLGYGIESFDAKYSVKAGCETAFPHSSACPTNELVHTKFTGLDHGIHATNGLGHRNFTVEDAVFSDNVCGVYSDGVIGFKVANCEFYVGGRDVSLYGDIDEAFLGRHRGVFSTEGYGFIIDENEIHQSGTINLCEGIVVGYSRDHSDMVFGNTVTGLDRGYIGEGICADPQARFSIGLQFLCNKNYDNRIGLWSRRVDTDPDGENQTIRTNQGSIPRAADNVFDRETGRLDIKNTNLDNNLIYWWQAPESPYKPLYNSGGVGVTDNSNGTPVYRPANNCRSRRVPHYPYPYPDIPSGVKSLLHQHRTDYASQRFLYDQLLDGGNTDALVTDLQANWPQGAWAMRDQLLDLSPYVSLDALKTAMMRPDFPAAMKAEVCIANPDATQQRGFMTWLRTECPYPPSETLLQSIEASWDTQTYRTQLEATMGFHHGEMTQAANQLLQYHQSDTLEHLDSLRTVWRLLRTPAARYAETLTYLQEGAYTPALAALDSLENEHRLNDVGAAELHHMRDVIDAFQTINTNGRTYAKMTAGDIATVETIIADHHDRATNWAQNILCWYHGHCTAPWTGGEMGDNTPKSRKTAVEAGGVNTEPTLRAYPNPSTNWTTIQVDLIAQPTHASVVIEDVAGRALEQLIVTNREAQLLLDARKLAPGTYTLRLLNNGATIRTEKLIIRQ